MKIFQKARSVGSAGGVESPRAARDAKPNVEVAPEVFGGVGAGRGKGSASEMNLSSHFEAEKCTAFSTAELRFERF
jgi:hypothetical protein